MIKKTLFPFLYLFIFLFVSDAQSSPLAKEAVKAAHESMDRYRGQYSDASHLQDAYGILSSLKQQGLQENAMVQAALGRLSTKVGAADRKNLKSKVLKQAESHFEKALGYDPRVADVYIYYAKLEMIRGRVKKSGKLVDSVKRIAYGDPRVVLLSAQHDFVSGKLQRAEKSTFAAINTTRNKWLQVEALSLLNGIYQKTKNVSGRAKVMKDLYSVAPEDTFVLLSYASFLMENKRYAEVLKLSEALSSLPRDSDGRFLLSAAYYVLGKKAFNEARNFAAAEKYFNSATVVNDKDWRGYFGLAIVYYNQAVSKADKKQLLEAEKLVDRAMTLDGSNKEVRSMKEKVKTALDALERGQITGSKGAENKF